MSIANCINNLVQTNERFNLARIYQRYAYSPFSYNGERTRGEYIPAQIDFVTRGALSAKIYLPGHVDITWDNPPEFSELPQKAQDDYKRWLHKDNIIFGTQNLMEFMAQPLTTKDKFFIAISIKEGERHASVFTRIPENVEQDYFLVQDIEGTYKLDAEKIHVAGEHGNLFYFTTKEGEYKNPKDPILLLGAIKIIQKKPLDDFLL